MSTGMINDLAVKRNFWIITVFYLLIVFEFFYMVSPFAIYFYSIYGPGLRFLSSNPLFGWLSSTFLPHIVVETKSPLINLHNKAGVFLFLTGFLSFCIGAGQVYYNKIVKKRLVTGGIYNLIRHPQYVSLAISGFGMLLLWPRYIVLMSFLSMLFAYYFLAKYEERECERKFGNDYKKYRNRTGMFLSFQLPYIKKLSGIPKSGVLRYLVILGLFGVTLILGVGLANGLRNLSLNSLYGLYTRDAAYISAVKLNKDTMDKIVQTAFEDRNVRSLLEDHKEVSGTKFINYILPVDHYVSEIPMKREEGAGGHHFFFRDWDTNLFKIIFTRAVLHKKPNIEGLDIILNTIQRIPIFEIRINLKENRVIDIFDPPENYRFKDISVPIY